MNFVLLDVAVESGRGTAPQAAGIRAKFRRNEKTMPFENTSLSMNQSHSRDTVFSGTGELLLKSVPLNKITLRVAGIVGESVTDGPGIRFVLFVQGCPRRCPGCHNPQTQCLGGGTFMTAGEIMERIEKDPLISGITFSGGEPFLQAEKLVPIARECRRRGLNVMTYSGWTFEELLEKNDPAWNALIELSDIIVDGPYLQEFRSSLVKFRGSTNQRLVNVALSLKTHSVQTL
ncbi:MAG: radical SAM protein [Thermoguttaceae bacterium]|nr:radical SAM protein [Thermoguttaceae bacterium]